MEGPSKKNQETGAGFLIDNLVAGAGFEPATFGL